MRTLLLLGLIVAVTASLAAATTPAQRTATAPKPATVTNPTLVALSKLSGPAFDAALMRELIPVHEEAVEIAMAATLNADHSELLQWNQRMIDRKSGHVRKMLTWLQEAGASPGRRNAGVASDRVKKMRALSGAALERAYLPMMAEHLEQSAALAALAATKATKPELKAMAQQAAAVEKQEVAMLRGWMTKWYGK